MPDSKATFQLTMKRAKNIPRAIRKEVKSCKSELSVPTTASICKVIAAIK